jgi:hypothetical protein
MAAGNGRSSMTVCGDIDHHGRFYFQNFIGRKVNGGDDDICSCQLAARCRRRCEKKGEPAVTKVNPAMGATHVQGYETKCDPSSFNRILPPTNKASPHQSAVTGCRLAFVILATGGRCLDVIGALGPT